MVSRVLPDANVLFSRTLRDWLFLLKLESRGDIFTIATTVDILAETVARFRDRYPDAEGAVITAIHDRIVRSADERIDSYSIDGTWRGRDGDDAHVHAAAKDGGVDVVLTCDAGWDRLASAEFPYAVLHPDAYFCLVNEADPESVRRVADDQQRYWLRRNGEADLPARLEAAACARFAARVRAHLDEAR